VPLLRDLQPGQYSQPAAFEDERGKKGVRILYLKSRTDPHRENLRDDYNKVADRALELKKEMEVEKWFEKKIHTYYISIDDEYKSCPEMQKWLEKK
jgi:peptidyl-prolyl cis-trans isomerase SurA